MTKNNKKNKRYGLGSFVCMFFVLLLILVLVLFGEARKDEKARREIGQMGGQIISEEEKTSTAGKDKLVDLAKYLVEEGDAVPEEEEEEAEPLTREEIELEVAKAKYSLKIQRSLLDNWEKPFNFSEFDYCKARIDLTKEELSFVECSSGEVLKHSIRRSFEKIKGDFVNSYNGVNLRGQILDINFEPSTSDKDA